jgi:hypothetical protein
MVRFFVSPGIQVITVKKVTSVLYFAKEVKVNERQELLEVRVKDVSHKEGVVETAWHPCIEVDLKIIDMMDSSGQKKKQLGAKELVQRFEAMRDCWLQLAHGLLNERQ